MARAEREGWQVVDVFTDNDVGASTKSKKARPAYRQMLKAAESGELDIILSYSASRLTRRPMEWEELIQLHDRRGVQLRTIASGDVNLETADGRAVARTIAAWDGAEAERISERVARAAKQRKEQGKRHGGFPPYGYDAAPDGRFTVNPERAAVVHEAARRVLNGESLYGIWTDFNRRGLKTGPSPRARDGARWQASTLKKILTGPAVIGCFELDDGTLRQVAEPILDRPTWERLREILYDDKRWARTCPPDWSSRRKYPLSGLLFCGREGCGHWLSGSMSTVRGKKVPSFICTTANGGCGKIRIDYPAVEDWVLGQVFARLDVPGVQVALSSREQRADDDELRQQIRDAERLLERLDDDHADGVLDRRRYLRQVSRTQERLDALRRELAEVQRSVFVVETGGRSLREVWAEHDATWQRTLLGHVIEKIVIEPHPVGMTTNLSRRRGESDESLRNRRREHRELLLLERVHVTWKQ